MKKRFLSLLPVVALLGVAVVGPAPAEAAEIRAHVPFSFIVNGTTMPPGTYTLSERNSVLFVQGATEGTNVIALRVESLDAVGPSLVFHRYGDQYFLRQAWSGGRTGRELRQQGIERTLAQAARRSRTASGFERVVIRAL